MLVMFWWDFSISREPGQPAWRLLQLWPIFMTGSSCSFRYTKGSNFLEISRGGTYSHPGRLSTATQRCEPGVSFRPALTIISTANSPDTGQIQPEKPRNGGHGGHRRQQKITDTKRRLRGKREQHGGSLSCRFG